MLTTKEISEMLKVSEETVRRWIRTGELNAQQEDGKSYLVNENDLKDFVKKKAKSTGSSIGKMASLLPDIKVVDLFSGAGAFAGEAFLKLMEKQSQIPLEKDKEQSIKAIDYRIESLRRKKKKLELEHQMKLLEIEEEIAKYEQIKLNLEEEK